MSSGRSVILELLILWHLFSHGQSLSTFPFQSFQFADNGVCLQPSYFQSRDGNLFTMRNVPGDGDCMFLAVALAAATSMGIGGNDALLQAISRETRAVVAHVLSNKGNLLIEPGRIVSASDLLKSAARKERVTPETYLELLKRPGNYLYGGGPELAVLSNVLRRPISVYEMDTTAPSVPEGICPIQCMGIFGEGMFEDPCKNIPNSAVLSGSQPGAYSWHLHILVVNASPTEKHACVLLPQFV